MTFKQNPALFFPDITLRLSWLKTKIEYLLDLTLLLAFGQALIRSTPLAFLWPAWWLPELKEKLCYFTVDSHLAKAWMPESSSIGLRVSAAMNTAGGSPFTPGTLQFSLSRSRVSLLCPENASLTESVWNILWVLEQIRNDDYVTIKCGPCLVFFFFFFFSFKALNCLFIYPHYCCTNPLFSFNTY